MYTAFECLPQNLNEVQDALSKLNEVQDAIIISAAVNLAYIALAATAVLLLPQGFLRSEEFERCPQ